LREDSKKLNYLVNTFMLLIKIYL